MSAFEPFELNESTTVDDVIEHVLIRLNSDYAGGCLDVADFCYNRSTYTTDTILLKRVIEKLYQHGVAKRCSGAGQSQTTIELTSKGTDFDKKGNWQQYLDQHREDQFRQQQAEEIESRQRQEAHQATLLSANATVDAARSAKRSVISAWFSGAVALGALLLSMYQCSDNQKIEQKLDDLQKKVMAIDSVQHFISPSEPYSTTLNRGTKLTK